MDAKLVVTAGAKPAKFNLRLPTVIGRSPDAQLKVKQHNVSRRHCEIFAADGQLMIRDLGSSNGTIINGERIEGEFVLSPGDELTLGTVQLCVVFPATATAAKPAESKMAAASTPKAASRPAETLQKKRAKTKPVDQSVGANECQEEIQLEGSAVLAYQDLDDGSFIAIEIDETLAPAVESAIKLDMETEALADESQIQLEADSREAAPVDDDSRLDDFLKGLGG